MKTTNLMPLKMVTDDIKPGVSLTRFKSEDNKVSTTIRVMSVKDLNNEQLYLLENLGEDFDVSDSPTLQKYVLQKGDVLISTKGSVIKTGVFNSDEKVYANSNLTIIKCSSMIIPEYLVIYLRTPKISHELSSRATGAAILNLTTESLRTLEVAIPELSIQHRIVDLHKELETYSRSRLAEVNLVKKTILHRTEQAIYG